MLETLSLIYAHVHVSSFPLLPSPSFLPPSLSSFPLPHSFHLPTPPLSSLPLLPSSLLSFSPSPPSLPLLPPSLPNQDLCPTMDNKANLLQIWSLLFTRHVHILCSSARTTQQMPACLQVSTCCISTLHSLARMIHLLKVH